MDRASFLAWKGVLLYAKIRVRATVRYAVHDFRCSCLCLVEFVGVRAWLMQ
jgi:hypothetical protein